MTGVTEIYYSTPRQQRPKAQCGQLQVHSQAQTHFLLPLISVPFIRSEHYFKDKVLKLPDTTEIYIRPSFMSYLARSLRCSRNATLLPARRYATPASFHTSSINRAMSEADSRKSPLP